MELKNMNTPKKSIFQRPLWVAIFALTAAIAWGWAYPLIKLGFEEFGITSQMTGSKMLFAGIRFMLSGLIILGIAWNTKKKFQVNGITDWWYIILFSLLNTTIHYACFYIGLSYSNGARAAILNSLGVFILVLLACAFFKTDKLNSRKIIGCTMGFSGILALNLGAESSEQFTWLGDGMIVLNTLCSAFAGLMTRGLSKRVDIFVGTGYSLAIGGALLILPSLFMNGTLPQITWTGILILILLIGISTIGFALFNKLLSCNPIGKVAIFNSLIPAVGAVTSCWCLHEPFYMNYILAIILLSSGIYIINKEKE